MSAPDPIEAAIDAFWTSAKGYRPGDCIAKDMRAAIAAYLRARADAMTTGMTTYKARMLAGFLSELAAELERDGEKP